MPAKLKQLCQKYKDTFFIGVHEPDLLFFEIGHPEMRDFADSVHRNPGRIFFTNAKTVYLNSVEKEETLVYIIGYLAHFALDSAAHAYVFRKVETEGTSHSRIESDYDRHLYELDGVKITDADRSSALKPSAHLAKIISQFYDFDQKRILKIALMQKAAVKLLNSSSRRKVDFMHRLFKRLNMEFEIDLMMEFEENAQCRNSNLRLDKYYGLALKRFPSLLENWMDYLDDRAQLNEGFNRDFTGSTEKNIPILRYEDELKYTISNE